MKNALRLSVPVILSILAFGATAPLAFAATPGDVSITEFIANSTVAGNDGEWIELQNNTAGLLNIAGWKVNTGADHLISGSYSIPAGGKAVVCNNSDASLNGGVNCNYAAAITLSNSGATILVIDDSTNEIASTTYAGTDVQAGKSIIVASDGSLSVETVNQYGVGDYGTPAGNTVSIGTHSYPSIQYAVDAASPSDTINVAAGTYNESAAINVNKDVSIVGEGAITIINPATDVNGFFVTASTTIQNLKIVLTTSGVDAQAIRLEGADNVTISGNTIETTGDKGIGIWIGNVGYTNSNNLNIIGNTITINSVSTGIYAEGGSTAQTGWQIKNNTVTTASSNALELYDVSNSEVSGNTFTITAAVDASNVMWFAELSDIANLVFSNNTVSGSSGSEVAIGSDFRNDGPFAGAQGKTATAVTISGNTFSNWGSRGLKIGDGVASVTVSSNKFLSSGEALNNFAGAEVNAESNYWGSANPDFGTKIVGTVDHDPWYIDAGKTTLSNSLKAITDFSFASPAATGVIDEGAKTISITVPNGTVLTALVPAITLSGGTVAPLSGVANDFSSPAHYIVTAGDDSTADYTVTVKQSQTITVGTSAPGSAVYGSSFSVAATSNSSLTVAVTTSGVCTNVGNDVTMTSGTGTCTVHYNQAGDGDYTEALEVTENVTAQKATPVITWANPIGITYGAALDGTQLSALSSGDGTPVYTPDAGAVLNAGAGQQLSVTFSATANYNSATQTALINVAQAMPTLSVTGSSVTYDGTPHAAGVSSVVAGVASNILTGGAANQTNAGTYAVTVDFLPDDSVNYESLVGASAEGNFVIDQADSTTVVSCSNPSETYTSLAITLCSATVTGVGGLNESVTVDYMDNIDVGIADASAAFSGDVNHNGSEDSTTFDITQAPLEVTANAGQSKVYGEADPVFSYSITAGSLLGTDTLSNSLSRDAGENVDSYAINQDTLTAGGNYNLLFVSDDFSITQAPLMVTADAQSKTYGDTASLGGTAFTPVGLQNGETIDSVTLNSDGVAPTAPADTYDIVPSAATGGSFDSNNYDISYNVGTLTVNQMPITVTAVSHTKTVDGDTSTTAVPLITGTTAAGDTATLSETYDDASIGTGKTLTPAVVVENGSNVDVTANYAVTLVSDTTGIILDTTQSVPAEDGSATVSSDTPEVVVTDPDQPLTVTVTSDVTNPTIDVSAFMTDDGEETTGILPEITINSDVANVAIPADTTVTGPADWDGIISAPILSTPSGTAPTGFSVGSTIISVGSPEGILIFSDPVTLVLAGVTGTVGYKSSGSSDWAEITNVCGGSYATPDAPTAPGECAISDGTDTKIVTYHFTSFGGLNKIAASSGSRGGGGGPGCAAGTAYSPITSSCVPVGATPAIPAIPARGQVLGAAVYNFTNNLAVGSRGADVTALQQLLIDSGYSVPAGATGYFGAQTRVAVMAFQKARGIAQVGNVGPLTRAELNRGSASSGVTVEQMNSILTVLQSFSVDQAVIDKVRAALAR